MEFYLQLAATVVGSSFRKWEKVDSVIYKEWRTAQTDSGAGRYTGKGFTVDDHGEVTLQGGSFTPQELAAMFRIVNIDPLKVGLPTFGGFTSEPTHIFYRNGNAMRDVRAGRTFNASSKKAS